MNAPDNHETAVSSFVVAESATVVKAMEALNETGMGILYVCNHCESIVATVTDGDIRRHILKNRPLDAPVSQAANYNFIKLVEENISAADAIMKKMQVNSIPVLDADGRLKKIIFSNSRSVEKTEEKVSAPVVIMAGGKGVRLHPYTNILPKPLIPIGDITITEHIMNRFIECGCEAFSMIVNYKRNLIKAYFMDCETGYRINFVDEAEPLGTGGGIKLLQNKINETFFVTNCDIIVLDSYANIYKYHKERKNDITIVCATKTVGISYGTVSINQNGMVTELKERPQVSFLTNTGMYVIEPEVIDMIPDNTFIHITDIIETCLKAGMRVGVYPVSEQCWLDMGQMDELEKMSGRLSLKD